MRKLVNVVLIVCIIALIAVVAVAVYVARQDKALNIAQPYGSATSQTLPATINNSSDLVDALNDQTDEERDYLSAIDDESLLIDSDKTELTNISETYDQNDF